MISKKSFCNCKFPLISRYRHDAIINHLYETIDRSDMENAKLIDEIKSINLKRNAKGQFERREK